MKHSDMIEACLPTYESGEYFMCHLVTRDADIDAPQSERDAAARHIMDKFDPDGGYGTIHSHLLVTDSAYAALSEKCSYMNPSLLKRRVEWFKGLIQELRDAGL